MFTNSVLYSTVDIKIQPSLFDRKIKSLFVISQLEKALQIKFRSFTYVKINAVGAQHTLRLCQKQGLWEIWHALDSGLEYPRHCGTKYGVEVKSLSVWYGGQRWRNKGKAKAKKLLELELKDKKEIQHPPTIDKWMHNCKQIPRLVSTTLSEMNLDNKIRHLYPRHCSEHMPWIARRAQKQIRWSLPQAFDSTAHTRTCHLMLLSFNPLQQKIDIHNSYSIQARSVRH